jgi:hypothetical protein
MRFLPVGTKKNSVRSEKMERECPGTDKDYTVDLVIRVYFPKKMSTV